MAPSKRVKVAVLGGGPAALAAAHELTAPDREDRFDVTVYQPGWRLGGKCASGRNLEEGGRIEEHGLHVWFGFYDNSFTLSRAVLEELDRPPSHPLATFEQCFRACDRLVLYDRQGPGWQDFRVTFPRNQLAPGVDHETPDLWQVIASVCAWALRRWKELNVQGSRGTTARVGELLLRLAILVAKHDRTWSQPAFLGRRRDSKRAASQSADEDRLRMIVLVALLCRFRDWTWKHVVGERCASDARLRLFFTTLDTFASAFRGIVRDRVLERGWQTVDHLDLCEWLAANGAHEVTVGPTPDQRAPLLRAVYDLAFAYPGGKLHAASAAAGTAMRNLLRLLFCYRGSVLYKMEAGMGDTVIAPLYEVLRSRGVRFEYFHAVSDLHLSSDGQWIDAISVIPQAEVHGNEYEPLVPVNGVACWPSEPLWDQLVDGEKMKNESVDFESTINPLGREPVTLRSGEHFDAVVLAIPVGALAPITTEIAERHPRFAQMLASARTVSTQAFQLWLTKATPDLGWVHGENTVAGGREDPLDTWSDMSYLLPREAWQAGNEVHALAYFCGVLEERPQEDHAQAEDRVRENVRSFLENESTTLWPRARNGGRAFDWAVLADRAERDGPDRLDAQYWCANTSGSARYVLTPAGSTAHRLGADESGVQNLVLAGDWTRNGLDGGCVEAAVTSGLDAARALLRDSPERRFARAAQTNAVA